MDTATKDLEALERDYLESKRQIRADKTLSYEKGNYPLATCIY